MGISEMHGFRPQRFEDLPVILRVAGFPVEVLAPFANDLQDRYLAPILATEAKVEAVRGELVDRLFSLVPGATPERRRLLLALKRDAFNGRPVDKYRERVRLAEESGDGVGDLLARVLETEGQLKKEEANLAAAYDEVREREIQLLLGFLEEPRFMRGLTMSSLEFVRYLPFLTDKQSREYGRRESGILASLLRYVTRAALKPSPFSTLTTIGLGWTTGSLNGSKPLHIADPDSWQESSTVRLQRYLIEHLKCIFARHLPIRQSLAVSVNQTVQAVPPDRYRFLRGTFWDLDTEKSKIRPYQPTMVNARLRGPLIEWLVEHSADPPWNYRELLDLLQEELYGDDVEAGSHVQATVDKLLEVGFLELQWPWAPTDLYPERQMSEFFESFPAEAGLQPVTRWLRRLLEIEVTYATATSSSEIATEAREVYKEIRRLAIELTELDPRAAEAELNRWVLHEDVFFRSSEEDRLAARLSASQAQEIFHNLEPMSRLSNVEAIRFDFLHSLAEHFARERPKQREIPFLDVFEAGLPVFQEYVKYEVGQRREMATEPGVFNPFEIPAIAERGEARRRFARNLEGCIEMRGEEAHLDRAALLRLLETLPPLHTDPRDFCAFVQPLNERCDDWVVNTICEGIRSSSRFAAVMDEPLQRRFTDHFRDRSSGSRNGREIEFVELLPPLAHSANIHPFLTRRVLEIPGVTTGLPADKRLKLRDLKVRFGSPGSLPELIDGSDRRIIPVFLGAVARSHLPVLAKFLYAFSTAEFRYRRPIISSESEGMTVIPRYRIGNVVYRRKSWHFDPAPICSDLARLSKSDAFRYLDRWRRSHGMPRQVFVAEPLVLAGVNRYTKPQFIDFTSPLLVEILAPALQKKVAKIRLDEALPGFDEHIPLGRGQHRALELQLEFNSESCYNQTAPTSEPFARQTQSVGH